MSSLIVDLPAWQMRFLCQSDVQQRQIYWRTLSRVLSFQLKLVKTEQVRKMRPDNPVWPLFLEHIDSAAFTFWYFHNPYCDVAIIADVPEPHPYIEEDGSEEQAKESSIQPEEFLMIITFSKQFMEPTNSYSVNKLLRQVLDLMLAYDDVRTMQNAHVAPQPIQGALL